ncbi:MAG: DUF2793 domain-containing protein [Bosea sp. (in: a-proteobacteria)]
MSDTLNLVLPLLAAAQAQKHVTHNEALTQLDALVHLAVLSRTVTSPPGAAADGARYLVPPSATGAFAGKTGQIGWFDNGVWRFLVPKAGWIAFVVAESALLGFDGSNWLPLQQLTGAAAHGATNPNLLANGDFLVNQRSFAGGTLAAGIYGPDRWKAASGGCSLSLAADGTATLSAGSIEQIVETNHVAPRLCGLANFASQTLWLSSDALASDVSGQVLVGANSYPFTLTAGAGRRSTSVTLAVADTGNLTVRLTATAARSFRRLKLEAGSAPSAFLQASPEAELRRCQRYFCLLDHAIQVPSAGYQACVQPFPVPMRSNPAAANLSPGTASSLTVFSDSALSTNMCWLQVNVTAVNGYLVGRTTSYSAEL